ncbi:MAG: capsule assembly Wzi family protein, partial [Verrucomicrobia bacterium]|nr:capsule assembly Wzi family protein [Deltaproteobacteria bacterium]
SALVEPMLQYSPDDTRFQLNRGYVKLGGGGLELEVGRDENWFGPGQRGALTLSGNAGNFDQVKLSSPEPLDVAWIKHWLGDVKYAVVVSRFNETDTGTPDHRRPYFIGVKLAVKPYSWFEYGFNFVRQQDGPGFTGSTTIQDEIFGGGFTNHNNSIAGVDLRFRIPWLRNTEVYGEYVGEDSAAFWPIVESYVAGIYAPCLTTACRDDLRFEFFWGNPMLYTDFKFPRGYTYNNMTPGHSQGGSAQDFFIRYSHSFSVRNVVALEYFHTDRGQEGRVKVNSAGVYDPLGGTLQAMEHKDGGRISWTLPILGDFDGQVLYGVETISNLNLVAGATRTNQLAAFELRYRY